MTVLQQELSQLSTSEKLLLVEDLWDQIAEQADTQQFSLSEAQKQVLDERYAAFLADPEAGSSWDEVKGRLLAR